PDASWSENARASGRGAQAGGTRTLGAERQRPFASPRASRIPPFHTDKRFRNNVLRLPEIRPARCPSSQGTARCDVSLELAAGQTVRHRLVTRTTQEGGDAQ